MNQNQKIVACITAGVIVLMFLFPPFHLVVDQGTFNRGFSFITDPPMRNATVNLGQLLVQLIAAGAVGGIAWHVVKS